MALQPLSFKLLWDVATMGSCQWTKTVVLTPTWGNVIINFGGPKVFRARRIFFLVVKGQFFYIC